MTRLTAKQAAFVKEYLVDLNGTQAAIRAGFSRKTARVKASQLMDLPHVMEAIDVEMAQREERTGITQDYVLMGLKEVAERCLQRAPVVNMAGNQVQDEEGNHLWQFNAPGANKALELLGKHLGMFKEKVEHSGPNGGAIPIERIERVIVDPKD